MDDPSITITDKNGVVLTVEEYLKKHKPAKKEKPSEFYLAERDRFKGTRPKPKTNMTRKDNSQKVFSTKILTQEDLDIIRKEILMENKGESRTKRALAFLINHPEKFWSNKTLSKAIETNETTFSASFSYLRRFLEEKELGNSKQIERAYHIRYTGMPKDINLIYTEFLTWMSNLRKDRIVKTVKSKQPLPSTTIPSAEPEDTTQSKLIQQILQKIGQNGKIKLEIDIKISFGLIKD